MVRMHEYVYIVFVCIHTHTRTYIHTYYIYTYIHTYIHTLGYEELAKYGYMLLAERLRSESQKVTVRDVLHTYCKHLVISELLYTRTAGQLNQLCYLKMHGYVCIYISTCVHACVCMCVLRVICNV